MQLILVLQVLLKKEENIQFKQRLKSLALNKVWEINVQEQLVIA